MKISKEHIGKTIYGVPTGNNTNRSIKGPQPPILFKVISVARRYAKLDIVDGPNYRNGDYCRENGQDKRVISSGYIGGGYNWFDSLEAIEIESERKILLEKLRRYFSSHAQNHMGYDDVVRVCYLAGIEVDNGESES